MDKSIVICGDSFNIGIGCIDLKNEPYGALLSKELDKPVINLAKGSSTNLSIFLQTKYAVDKMGDKIDLVIVSHTSYDRANWFPVDYISGGEIENTEVNYHQYPPYGLHTYHSRIDHPYANNREYKGKMFTDNYRGIIDYWETFGSKNKKSEYYARFINEPKERMKTLYDYATTIHNDRIERINCIGLMTMAHLMLKRSKIKHLILTNEIKEYNKYIDIENLVEISWGDLSLKFPDPLNSLHTSAEGHKIVFENIIRKLNQNEWYN